MQTQVNKLDFIGEKIYVGMDTHKNSWKISIVHGELLVKTFVQTPGPDALFSYLKKNYPGAEYYTAYEASYCGYWIHYRLQELGVNSIIVNPADIPTTNKEHVQKEDKRDSRKIARCLRNGDLMPIHVPTMKTLQDRTLIRIRYTLNKELRRFKHRIKSLLLFYGIEIPEVYNNRSGHWPKRFVAWLETLTFEEPSATYSLKVLIQQVKNYRDIMLDITRQIRELSKTPAYKKNIELLTSIPGIALITAMLIIVELEDLCRFKSLDQLCSYVGLIPSTNSSGDKEIVGEITSRGHNRLRTAIVETAWIAVKNDPALLMAYAKLCKRMDGNKAIIRIAKKILNRIRYVLKNQQEYVKAVVK
jgi:transposase